MRKIITIMSMMIVVLGNMANANAETLYSELVKFEIGHKNLLGANSGNVQIDLEKKMITLTLLEKAHCPKGAMCILGFYPTEKIEVPLTDIQYTACGDTYKGFLGEKTSMEEKVINKFKSIEVTDFSNAICDIYVIHPVEVRFTSIESSDGNFSPAVMVESLFFGEYLK